METYYTYWNYAGYGAALAALAILCLALREALERKASAATITALALLIASAVAIPVSRTCPYAAAAAAFAAAGIVALVLGATMLALSIAFAALSGDLAPALRGPSSYRLDRWILDSIRGSVIIMDADRLVIARGDIDFDGLGPEPGDSAADLARRFREAGYEPELEGVMSRIASGESPAGELDWRDGRYRYWCSTIGAEPVKGYAFSLVDVTDEYRLVRALEAQNHGLLNRARRLSDESELDLSLARETENGAANREAAERLRAFLVGMDGRLRGIADLPTIERTAIDEVIAESRVAMERIRAAVHRIPYA